MALLRVPKIFNLRTDPHERVATTNTLYDWMLDRALLPVTARAQVANMLMTPTELPARQEPASFSIDQVLEKLEAGITSA